MKLTQYRFSRLTAILNDPDAEVRTQASRVLGDIASIECDRQLIAHLQDENPRVRFFASLALGKRKNPDALPHFWTLLDKNHDTDPFLRYAGIIGLVGLRQSRSSGEIRDKSIPRSPPCSRRRITASEEFKHC